MAVFCKYRGVTIKKLCFFIISILLFSILLPVLSIASQSTDDAKKEQIHKQMNGTRVPFVENKGQIKNENVKFYDRIFDGTVFVNESGFLIYKLPIKGNNDFVLKEIFTEKKMNIKGLDPSATSVNYFKGKNKNNWKTDIPSYNRISLGEIFNGIEVTLQIQGNTVEKVFTVSPNKNPEQIQVKLDGCKKLEVNKNGELEVITEYGTIKFTKPIAFQIINGKKQFADIDYIVNDDVYSFEIAKYDTSIDLVIDQMLSSTFLDGYCIGGDVGFSVAHDESGNIYVCGYAGSADFSITQDAYGDALNDADDAFIAKL
jgi:hypothetical protein